MKPRYAFVGLCAAIWSAVVTAAVANSEITAVTVYADRAVVTRTAHVDVVVPGVAEVTFDRLPASLQEYSLQASGRGTSQAKLLDVTARDSYVDYTPDSRVRELEQELAVLDRETRTLSDRAGVLDKQRDYVFRIQAVTTTPVKEGVLTSLSPSTWQQLLDFSESQLTKMATERQSIDQRGTEIEVRAKSVTEEMESLRQPHAKKAYKTVVVRLDAASPGSLEVNLRYAVQDARWDPIYDARVVSDKNLVYLSYFGSVRQNTGEDWTKVEMTLSTARPSLGGKPPELQPWRLDTYKDDIMFAMGAGSSRKMSGVSNNTVNTQAFTGMAEAAPAVQSVMLMQAQLETQATSATFKIPVAATVPSNNSAQKVPIAVASFAAAREYLAIPKQVKAAFLTAKVTNTSEFPLLTGQMNVFLDDTFIASSSIRTVMPGEKFDLALGADEGIAVKRTLDKRFTEETGVMSKGTRVRYAYTLTIQNNKKTAEVITLLDQIPVSQNEKIEVVPLMEVEPSQPDKLGPKADSAGIVKWTLPLGPGEKRTIPFRFMVAYPADLRVVGLD